jgi:hypothetical protein
MSYSQLLILHAVCILLICIAIFIPRGWLRALAVLAGAVAVWLPLLIHLQTLGRPNPQPPPGEYQLLTAQSDAARTTLYLYVDGVAGQHTPKLYAIPYPKSRGAASDDAEDEIENMQIISISPGEGGEFEVLRVDREPPDLPKEEPDHGTRYQ